MKDQKKTFTLLHSLAQIYLCQDIELSVFAACKPMFCKSIIRKFPNFFLNAKYIMFFSSFKLLFLEIKTRQYYGNSTSQV